MERLSVSLEMLAVSTLRTAIAAVGRLPGSSRITQVNAIDRLRPAASQDTTTVRRVTIGRGLPSSARLLLTCTGRLRPPSPGRGRETTFSSRTLRTLGDKPAKLAAGDSVRYVPIELPLMALDQDVALLSEAQPKSGGVLVVRDEQAVHTLAACHDLLWNATQIRTTTVPGTDGREPLEDELEAVVTELAAGLSDTAAARNLHISERTMSRRMGELLDQLGAATRFQAGYLAARREMA
jgi:hypothetical protein